MCVSRCFERRESRKTVVFSALCPLLYHPHHFAAPILSVFFSNTIHVFVHHTPQWQDMEDMYSEATEKGAKFLEAPVSGSKVDLKCFFFMLICV